MKKKNVIWIALAVLMFAAATWLMSSGRKAPENTGKQISFPRRLKPDEYRRMKARQRQLMLRMVAGRSDEMQEGSQSAVYDPMLVALSVSEQRDTMLIFETAELAGSPVVRMLINCMPEESVQDLNRLKEETGIDPFENLERAAVTGDMMLLEGDFEAARWENIFDEYKSENYGDSGVIHRPPGGGDGGKATETYAVWNNEMLIRAQDEESSRKVIDLLEGREEYGGSVFEPEDTYGQIYGRIAVEDALNFFPDTDDDMAARFSQAVDSIGFHLDATEDVALVADMSGQQPEMTRDVASSLGGALSLARMKARAEGQEDLAEFLDFARIDPDEGSFSMELALPIEYIRERLGECAGE